jgi:enoyl-CoA hydratase/carnithine racemase
VPDVGETWSPLSGRPALAIDCTVTQPAPAAAGLATALRRLADLPCPSVALLPAASAPAGQALAAVCDVVVATAEELAVVLAAITRTPLAAATLVQVLRAGAALATSEALTVESLAYATLQGGPEFAAWLRGRRPPATVPTASAPPVRIERNGTRLVITFDRPARHNAFSAAMRDGLVEALALATLDPGIADIVLRGAGPSFCSGGDLDEFGTFPDPVTAHAVRTMRSPARLLAPIAGRVRAEVHGACIGAGIELAAFASSVTATPDAFFQLPEVAMGLVPGAGGTVSVARRIGRQRTAWLALTGHRLDAGTAQAWGLIDAIAG